MSISNYLAADYSQLAKQAVGLTTEPSLVADKSVLLAERKESKLAALGKRGTGFTETSGLTSGKEYESALADALATPDEKSKVDPALRSGALGDHLKFNGFDPDQVDSLVANNDINGLRNLYYGNSVSGSSKEGKKPTEEKVRSSADYEAEAREQVTKERYENEGILDKAQKAITAIPAGVAKGAVELADVIQEVVTLPAQAYMRSKTGDSKYDIDFLPDERKKSIQEVVDTAVGYDRETTDYATSRAMRQLKDAGAEFSWEGIGRLFTDPKQRDALLNALKTGAVNWDIVTGSLGELGGGAGVGGAAVKGVGKIAGAVAGKIDDVTGAVSKEAKVANAGEEVVTKDGIPNVPVTTPSATDIVNNIGDALKLNSTKLREELAAIDKSGLSKAEKAAAIAELEKTYTLGKATADIIKGSVMTNTYAANLLNNHIQQFKDNNKGEDPSWTKLAEMATLVKITSGTEVGAVKYALGIKTLTSEEKKEIAKASVAGTIAAMGTRLGIAGGLESGQEILEGVAEQLNTKLDSADYKGKSAQDVLREASAEIIAGGAMGFAGGVQMKGAGMAAQATTNAVPAIGNAVNAVTNSTVNTSSNATAQPANKETTVAVEEPKVRQYANTLIELRDAIQTNAINETTISDYIDKVESLYDIRTGVEGFTPEQMKGADDTYKAIANRFNEIILANPELKLSKVVTPDILGSAPEVDVEKLAEELSVPKDTKNTDPVLAERVLSIALGSTSSEQVNTNAVKYLKFAVTNGLSKEEAIQLVKNYASVEEEATVSDRGYKTYTARAKAIQASDNPDTEQVNLIANKLEKFMVAVDKSASQISDLLDRAQTLADKYNKVSPPPYVTKKSVKGEYKKLDGSPYAVSIVKQNGKWVVSNDTQARQILATKRRYVEEMKQSLRDIASKRTDTPFNLGEFVVPVNTAVTSGVKRAMMNDQGFINNNLKTVEPLIGKKKVTKVIVDTNNSSDKWKEGSDYHRYNSEILNRDDYTSNDVVLVHGNGTKGSVSSFAVIKDKQGNVSKHAEQLRKAMLAGSTVVLDRDFISKETNNGEVAGTLNSVGRTLERYITSNANGYIKVPGSVATYVKNTEEVQKGLAKLKAESEAGKAKKEELSKLVDMAALVKAQEQGVVALNEEAEKAAKSTYDKMFKAAASKYFSKGEPDGKAPEVKLQEYIDREIKEAIKAKVNKYGASVAGVSEELDKDLSVAHEVNDEGKPTNLKTGKIALAYMAREAALKEAEASESIIDTLKQWKELLNKRLGKEATEAALTELVKASGLEELLDSEGDLLKLHKDLLEKSIAKGKEDKYELTYVKPDGSKDTTVSNSVLTEYKGYPVIEATKVVVDVNGYVTPKDRTLLNTVPVGSLPNTLVQEIEKFRSALTKTVKGKNTLDDTFWLTESPGRSLIFNESGTVSPQVAAAMWIAVMEMIKTDKYKLMLGAKSRKDVAMQLNIPESQVTKEQVEFAKKHGMLNKTAANSLGKAVLAELGLGKKNSDEVAKGHYETLAADLGNMAIATAVKMGWMSYTKPSTAEVTKFYTKSDNKSDIAGEREVRYVNITPSLVDGGTKELKGGLASSYKSYDGSQDMLPVVATARKEPYTKLSDSVIEQYTKGVRNDGTGGAHTIPKVAVETLENLMRTDYTIDVPAAIEFLKLVDAENSTIKSQLGYVTIDESNPAYVQLTYEDKDIQEGINRGIDKSIDELREFVKRSADGSSYNVQFPFYYTSNGRYMMDSNTINPQSDKVHRFLVQPAAHRLNYEVIGDGGAAKFTVNGQDVSYYVRVALAQAFGLDIDKLSTKNIIKAGNELLSLTEEDVQKLKTEIVNRGKAKLTSGLEIEAVHITHTLQGIDFLLQSKTGKVASSLTAEFDSVTNGFMNKLMQLPILSSLQDHLARVGILSKEYINSRINDKEPLAELLTEGEAVNVLLSKEGAARGLLDSYKNLASYVGQKLAKDPKVGFAKLYKYLPKPEDDGGISSALRSLFKAPFMTFNYSASLKNINESLSYDLVDGLYKKIAKGDTEGEEVAKAMFEQFPTITIGKVVYKGDEKGVKALINAVRNSPSSDIRASKVEVRELLKQSLLNSYGKHVQTAFETNFGRYIKLQDAINDAFKISYRLFEKEFTAELDKLQRSKKVLSEKDYKDTIAKLWDKFPAIKGPLSEVVDNGFDVIPVVGSKSTSSSGEVTYRDRADSVLVGEGTKTTRQTVRAVMKLLEEAGKAGSVIPFHYIDGAEMGTTVNELHSKGPTGVTAIHDALMVPLNQFDEATLTYNKNIVAVNSKYSLLDSLLEMVNKWPNSVDVKTDGLITAENGKLPIQVVVSNIINTLMNDKKESDEKRLVMFSGNGDLVFNNLVGTAGGAYKGNNEVDYSYLAALNNMYTNEKVGLENKTEELVDDDSKVQLEGKSAIISVINNLTRGSCSP